MDKLIETIVGAIEDKKGKNIVSLDLSAVSYTHLAEISMEIPAEMPHYIRN